MGKRLIIAEKPSVAKDIAGALHVPYGGKGYFESPDWVVSSALGHLFEIVLPAELAACRDKWRLQDLPLLPSHFDLVPLSHAKQQLNLLLSLIKRSDITGVVNACDAGREGELIFHYIVRYANSNKPVERLWLQSMTHTAILESFKALRRGSEMQPLVDAAVSRSESDWLVGINGSRVLTLTDAKNSLTPVGRVQTPTLAMVVARDLEILHFVPKDYWLVKATFGVKSGSYEGNWFDPAFKGEGRPEQIWDVTKAEAIKARCNGKTGIPKDQTKQVSKNCPALYDLTTLQREANKKLGYSAANTLKLAQELYETHKVLTYPRTDCRVLPDDYVPVASKTMDMLATSFAPVQGYAKKVVDSSWIKQDKRIFNSAKVTDHFAIIPTVKPPENLPPAELALYKMVAQRFVAVFFPAAEYLDTERITKVDIDHFKSRGRVVVNPGWTVVYGADAMDDDKEPEPSLVPILPNEIANILKLLVVAEKTKPPLHYTEATLLSAMEGAGKVIDDDELKDAMAERGLGTPATRAAIIEGLLSNSAAYLERKKKELWATQKGMNLIARLKSIALESLCSPQLTGEWEFKLKQMEAGKTARLGFMQEITVSVALMVSKVKATAPVAAPVKDMHCPKCKKELVAPGPDALMCPERHIMFRRIVAKRQLTDAEIKTLLETGTVGPLQGFTSKEGKAFAAKLKFDEKGQLAFDFGPSETPTETIQHLGWQLGICESVFIAQKGKHKLYIRRHLCQREISLDEAKLLLSEGKVGPFNNFVSKAGKTFSACLALKNGKVEFDFD